MKTVTVKFLLLASLCLFINSVVATIQSGTSSASTEAHSSSTLPTPAQKYGIGTIAILIVSLLALLGIIMIPCFGSELYPKILMVLTALAVGTLLSDAMLHLIPDILEIDDDDIPYMHIPQYAVHISVAISAIWIFWIIETVLHHFAHIERVASHSHGSGLPVDGHSHNHLGESEPDLNITITTNRDLIRTNSANQNNRSNQHDTSRVVGLREALRFGKFDIKKIRATAWILLLGDGIHNFADGIAIGASFAFSVNMGITTTIAVICHEVPHELGNYAVLVSSGFNHCQALLLNLASSFTCLVGFYIGASVSTDPMVSKWIFTITAGMFLYISLFDLLPQVMHGIKWDWLIFLACNLAMIFGYGVMLLLVVIEDHMEL